jgi:hypothetical protein
VGSIAIYVPHRRNFLRPAPITRRPVRSAPPRRRRLAGGVVLVGIGVKILVDHTLLA